MNVRPGTVRLTDSSPRTARKPTDPHGLFSSPVRISHGRLKRLGEAALYVAHETKAMLAVAQVAAHTMEQAGPAERPGDLKAMRVLRGALVRATALLDEILCYGTERPLEFKLVVLQDVVGRVAQTARIVAEGEGAHVRIDEQYPDDMSPVWADESLLESVLMNLALNGLQALGTEGGELRFSVSAESNLVQIRIRNSGPAVSSLRCRCESQRFVTGKRRGTGLGLRIARAGIEAHGGCLTLRQDEPHSVTAMITLPIAPCHRQDMVTAG
ncbi:MAG: HAMP domain-containing sensor histidine kinase [Bacillota bacterium]